MVDQPDKPAVLITGAGKRLGRVLALAFAEDGHPVAVHYNSSAGAAEAVVDAIVARGGRAVALARDLSAAEQAGALVEEAVAALGPVGCLVNSASLYGRDSLASLGAESWRRLIDVNLTAPVFLMQAFAAQAEIPDGGAIINFLDTQIAAPSSDFFSYFAAKIGLEGATRLAAHGLAGRGIRVNGIAPGLVLPSDGQTQDQFEARQRLTPMGAGLGADEIVAAARYLAHARHVTGQVIAVDSGQRLMGFGNSALQSD